MPARLLSIMNPCLARISSNDTVDACDTASIRCRSSGDSVAIHRRRPPVAATLHTRRHIAARGPLHVVSTQQLHSGRRGRWGIVCVGDPCFAAVPTQTRTPK